MVARNTSSRGGGLTRCPTTLRPSNYVRVYSAINGNLKDVSKMEMAPSQPKHRKSLWSSGKPPHYCQERIQIVQHRTKQRIQKSQAPPNFWSRPLELCSTMPTVPQDPIHEDSSSSQQVALSPGTLVIHPVHDTHYPPASSLRSPPASPPHCHA